MRRRETLPARCSAVAIRFGPLAFGGHEQTDVRGARRGSTTRPLILLEPVRNKYTSTKYVIVSSTVVLGVLRSGMKPFTPISRRACETFEKLTNPLGVAPSLARPLGSASSGLRSTDSLVKSNGDDMNQLAAE